MTNFFARIGERATGRAPVLRVRPPQPFEAARPVRLSPGLGDIASGANDLEIVDTALDAAPRHAGRAAGQRPAQNPAGSPAGRAVAAQAAVPSERSTPVSPVAAPAVREPEPPPARPRLERDTAPPAARPAPPPPRPTPELDAGSPGPEPSAPSHRTTQPAPEAVLPPPTRQRPREQARPAVPEPPAIDLADLMRRHVFPALVARGLVSSRDRVDVVTEAPQRPGDDRTEPPVRPRRAGAPRSQTVTVTASPARRATGDPVTPNPAGNPGAPVAARRAAAAASEPSIPSGPPQVHVHIDRVVVARPAPASRPAAPAPPPRPRPLADHDTYLARRRENR